MGFAMVKTAGGENLVALCDVDWSEGNPKDWKKNPPIKISERYPQARRFTHSRERLDVMGDKIDAVFFPTPDHTLFLVAMSAVEKGKHLFCKNCQLTTSGRCEPCARLCINTVCRLS